ncbi:MAG: hypothetical protein ACRCZB_00250 [Bacteroidales bacterium]
MKPRLVVILLSLSALFILSQAQAASYSRDYPKGYDADMQYYFKNMLKLDKSMQIGFDFGGNFLSAGARTPELFREGGLSPSASQLYWGLMLEKFVYKFAASVTSGVYFSRINTYLHGRPFSSGTIYLLVDDNSEEARYLQLRNTSSVSSYISIPIEGKYEFISSNNFGVYGKLGVLASLKVNTQTSYVSSSTIAEDKLKVEELLKNNSAFFSTANVNLGFRFGSYDRLNFRLEVGLPFVLTKNMGVLELGPNTLQGVNYRFMLALPLSFFLPQYNQSFK